MANPTEPRIDATFGILHEETNCNESYDFGEGMTDADTRIISDGKVVGEIFAG